MKKMKNALILMIAIFTSAFVYPDFQDNLSNGQGVVQTPSSKKQPTRRTGLKFNTISPEQKIQEAKEAAAQTSALKNLDVQNSIPVQASDSFTVSNPLVGKAAPKPLSNSSGGKKVITQQVNGQVVQTIKNGDGSTIVLTSDPVKKIIISRVTTDASGNIIPQETWYTTNNITSSSSPVVRSNKVKVANQSANEQVEINPMDSSSDVLLDAVYPPEAMDSNSNMEYADRPLQQPAQQANSVDPLVNFDTVYNPSIVESAINPNNSQVEQPQEASVDYADVYNENNSLGSALGQFTSHNPTKQNKSTDLVVYDPTQKYQTTLGISEAGSVKAPQLSLQSNRFKPATNLALYNALQQKSTQATSSIDSQPIIIDQNNANTQQADDTDVFSWAQNVTLPTSVTPINSQVAASISKAQTQAALDSRNKMIEGFNAQAQAQESARQLSSKQAALQSKKPSYTQSIE